MEPIKILLVEDDPNLGMTMKEVLEMKEPCAVTVVADGTLAVKVFDEQSFDLCILDIMLPSQDGFAVARSLRAAVPGIPIIFATARDDIRDKKKAYEAGADDYIAKPFSIDELIMRMRALLKRVQPATEEQSAQTFKMDGVTFDVRAQMLSVGPKEFQLTARETEVFQVLCDNLNTVVTREDLLLKVWRDDSYFNGRSLDVYLARLRKYIRHAPALKLKTIYGTGFKLISLPN